MDIKWITIRVNDFTKSKEFYRDYLGMKAEHEFSPNESLTIAFFEADNGMKVELIYNKDLSAEVESGDGISLGIYSSEYDKLLQQARENNILTAEPAIIGGHMECFFVNDPNGIGIQIIKQN